MRSETAERAVDGAKRQGDGKRKRFCKRRGRCAAELLLHRRSRGALLCGCHGHQTATAADRVLCRPRHAGSVCERGHPVAQRFATLAASRHAAAPPAAHGHALPPTDCRFARGLLQVSCCFLSSLPLCVPRYKADHALYHTARPHLLFKVAIKFYCQTFIH